MGFEHRGPERGVLKDSRSLLNLHPACAGLSCAVDSRLVLETKRLFPTACAVGCILSPLRGSCRVTSALRADNNAYGRASAELHRISHFCLPAIL